MGMRRVQLARPPDGADHPEFLIVEDQLVNAGRARISRRRILRAGNGRRNERHGCYCENGCNVFDHQNLPELMNSVTSILGGRDSEKTKTSGKPSVYAARVP